MYEIEKGIERPKRRSPMWERAYPWHEMDIGDSFLIPNGTLESPYSVIGMPNTHYKDKKFSCRKVDGGHRVWRIK